MTPAVSTSSNGNRGPRRRRRDEDADANPCRPPQAQDRVGPLPVLTVSLDVATLRLAWRAPDSARWRGRCRSIEEVCAEADAAGVPARCLLDYVER